MKNSYLQHFSLPFNLSINSFLIHERCCRISRCPIFSIFLSNFSLVCTLKDFDCTLSVSASFFLFSLFFSSLFFSLSFLLFSCLLYSFLLSSFFSVCFASVLLASVFASAFFASGCCVLTAEVACSENFVVFSYL